MSFDIPEFTPAEHICCTSVYDAGITIRNTTDVGVLYQSLAYEKKGQKRQTLIKSIKSRIRKLECAR